MRRAMSVSMSVGVVVGMVVVLHVSLLRDLVRRWQLNELWLKDWHQVLHPSDVRESTPQTYHLLLELVDGPAIERGNVVRLHRLQVGERRYERRCVVLLHSTIASESL